jgi:hypothetical protein
MLLTGLSRHIHECTMCVLMFIYTIYYLPIYTRSVSHHIHSYLALVLRPVVIHIQVIQPSALFTYCYIHVYDFMVLLILSAFWRPLILISHS